jgi:hypothetical protein
MLVISVTHPMTRIAQLGATLDTSVERSSTRGKIIAPKIETRSDQKSF